MFRELAPCSIFTNTWLHDVTQHELDSNSLLTIQPQHFLDLLHIGATAAQEDKKTMKIMHMHKLHELKNYI
jgi:hypothetical protein